MAFNLDNGFIDAGLKAASNIAARIPVTLDTVADQVVPAGTCGVRPYGISGEATALQGEALAVYGPHNIRKALSVASVGAGAEVGVATANGALGVIAGASGITKFTVGLTRTAGGAGEVISVLVSPRQISNLI